MRTTLLQKIYISLLCYRNLDWNLWVQTLVKRIFSELYLCEQFYPPPFIKRYEEREKIAKNSSSLFHSTPLPILTTTYAALKVMQTLILLEMNAPFLYKKTQNISVFPTDKISITKNLKCITFQVFAILSTFCLRCSYSVFQVIINLWRCMTTITLNRF